MRRRRRDLDAVGRARATGRTSSAPIAPSRTRAAGTRRRRVSSSITPAGSSASCGSRARAPIWRRSHGDGFAALRLDEVEPLRSRETMDDASMVDYLRRCALGARPAAPVHRDAPARVRGRRPRRPHASRRGHRADVVARRSLARRGGVRRRGGLARLPASGLRHVEADRRAPRRASVRPCRPARAPRPRHVGQRRPRRPTGAPSSSSRELPRR